MDIEDRANKHLNLQERYDIEDGLNKGYTVSAIARKLGRDYRSEQCRNTLRTPYVCNGCHLYL